VARSLRDHDRAPDLHDQDPADFLGDALSRLKIKGAIFLHARYTDPWAFNSYPPEDFGAVLAPEARRVIPFHVVAAGRCWVEVSEGERHWAAAGDVIVLPYSNQHRMGGTSDAIVVEASALVAPPPWDQMPYIEYGEGGDLAHIVCGFITCDDPLFDPSLRALPEVIVVTPTGPAAHWVKACTDYAIHQTSLVDSEHAETPPMLAQLLLVEALKLHLADVPAAERGFIAALHDPVVAPAMARIHAEPERKWTVATLAAESLVSESLLDERFRSVLGLAPIRYLTAWRMHLAQDLLSSTTLGIAVIARRVGYESEEAFSRAFKRKHGVAPSRWRVPTGRN
jgi:AraC-like DNA-binding protein